MAKMPAIPWTEVTEVIAVKEDVFGPPTVSLVFTIGATGELFITPDSPGFYQVVRALHDVLPDAPPDWYDRMWGDDTPNNFERVIFQRSREPGP